MLETKNEVAVILERDSFTMWIAPLCLLFGVVLLVMMWPMWPIKAEDIPVTFSIAILLLVGVFGLVAEQLRKSELSSSM